MTSAQWKFESLGSRESGVFIPCKENHNPHEETHGGASGMIILACNINLGLVQNKMWHIEREIWLHKEIYDIQGKSWVCKEYHGVGNFKV